MSRPKVFIIDDDPDICTIVRLAFTPLYDVEEETNGRRALTRLDEVRPDVVICDLIMPGMDGLTLTERVRAARPDVLLVIITAATKRTDLPDAFWRIGTPADLFFTKPFDPQLLVARVHELRVQRLEAKRQAAQKPYGPLPPPAKVEPEE